MKNIYVLGGATVDIMARSEKSIIAGDSNPGQVRYSFGGVAHNIASNLALYGCRVNFITALSEDGFGRQILESCQEMGLNMEYCQLFSDRGSAVYVAVVDPEGEMNVAVADMDLLSHLDTEKLIPVFEKVQKDDIVVVDTNFTCRQIASLIANITGKIYADPISTSKAVKIRPFLDRLEFLKPNLMEAEVISGMKVEGENDYYPLLKWFIDRGVKTIAISMASSGVIASDGNSYLHIGNIPSEIVNTTGAGDAFMAGYIYGRYNDEDFENCIRYALAGASLAMESYHTVNPLLDPRKLRERYDRVCREAERELLKERL